MLMPKKVKYRKMHRGGRIRSFASQKTNLDFGSFGLKSLETGLISSRQIEAARRVVTRYLKKGGKVWIRVFPDKPMTKKGSEVRMGGGKGPVDHYVAVVRPGIVLFEIDGVAKSVAQDAMRQAGYKLSVKTSFVVTGERV